MLRIVANNGVLHMEIFDFFIQLLTYFRGQFEGTFNNIPRQNELSTLYLIGNFLFLVLAPFLSNNSGS